MPKQKAQRRKATAPRKRVSRMIPPTVYSAWTTIGGWCLLTGMSSGATYNWISRGDLETRKNGKRVLINVQKGLAKIEALPPATVRLARAPRRDAAAPPS